jgi:hypothetical protein
MKTMKFLFLSMIAAISFVGCQNESGELPQDSSNEKLTPNSELVSLLLEMTNESGSKKDVKASSLGLVYPIAVDVIFQNSQTRTITFNNPNQLYGFLKILTNVKFITIKYPVSVKNENGEVIVVNNNQEFLNLIKPVVNNNGNCNKVKYPFTVETTDGSITVNNNTEFTKLLQMLGKIKFPFNVTDDKGVVTSIEQSNFQSYVSKLCKDTVVVVDNNCNKVKYPFTVDTKDGPITVNNNTEFKNLLRMFGKIKFPFNVTDDKGVVTSIEQSNFQSYVSKLCKDTVVVVDNNCNKVKYPLVVDTKNGSSVTVNNDTELRDLLKIYNQIKFPINITDDKGVVTVVTANGQNNLQVYISKLCKP